MGTGGAPEGVLAAAALRATGGQMMGRLIFANDEDRVRANKMGISDFNRKYLVQDMAKGEVIFIASGVTDGDLLKGVKKHANSITTNSLIMLSANSSINYITSRNL
jgi:fructose-1,6-bisphosphatase II / sedoheptulose-1,7-bisphosphatase